MAKPKFKVTKDNDAIVIHNTFKRNKNWEQWFLLNSDRHWDNIHSDQKMMKEHLNEAVERNAIVIDTGDFFCAMQGKYDKRSSKSAMRPEHQHGDYLDRLVETGIEWFAPYADRLAFMSPGNHEESIHHRHETNLTERLVSGLRIQHKSPVLRHRYSGFTRFQFWDPSQHQESIIMWHTHGYGGGGPVTKDIIQTARQGAFLEGTDIVVSGHTHDAWVFYVSTRSLSKHNNIVRSERVHIKVPSAKDRWGGDSWEDHKGHPPKPVGAYWLHFWWSSRHKRILYDAHRAW